MPDAFESSTGGNTGPVPRANLDDYIYERLKAQIAERTLLPGERIVPEHLARTMGVSRTPMLSALKRLQQEQLVEWRSRHGVFVRRLSKRDLALVFELREVLEGLAARRAAAAITPEQVKSFRDLFRGIDGGETPELRRIYMRQDYLFHSGLLELAQSAPLLQTMRSVNILVSAFGAGLLRPFAEVMAEHGLIFEALLRRDPDAAEAAMRVHIRRSVEALHRDADADERGETDGAGAHPCCSTREENQIMRDTDRDSCRQTKNSSVSRRRILQTTAIGAALPNLMAASLSRPAHAAARRLDTLVIAVQEGDTRTLDPQDANELTVPLFLRGLYDQMLTFPGSDFSKVTSDFATKWDASSDGLTYVFALNPNIKFSDGKPASADDVVFSLKRQKNLKGPTSWFQNSVTSVAKTGEHEVTIKLRSLNVDWLFLLTSPFLSIGEASAIRAHGGNDSANAATSDTARAWLDQHSAGSGPFVLEAWEHGSQLTMTRNPYYWGKQPPFNRVVFKFIADPNVQRALLVRGDAHFAVNLTPDLAAAVQKNKNVGVAAVPSLGFPWLGLHVNHNPALKKEKSWEAIKYAIDYDGMAKIYRGGGQFMASCIPPGLPNALPVSERIRRDIARAKAALTEAGYPNGFTFNLTFASNQIYQNVPATIVAEKLKEDLQTIGIVAQLRPEPSTQELTDFRAGKLEAAIHFWGADYIGWTDFLPVFAPGGHVAAPRQGWTPEFSPTAKRIAELSMQATRTLDATQQQKLCYEAQRLMNQVGPYAWLFEANIQIAYRKDIIRSFATNPVWYVDIGSIELV